MILEETKHLNFKTKNLFKKYFKTFGKTGKKKKPNTLP